jgi:protein-S-isoprenylcysteine O-methyltransferase Ste14
MKEKINWTSILITLLALSIVYVVGTAFFNIELERLIEHTITPHIKDSSNLAALSREIYSGIDQFMASNHIRVFGYTCIVVMILIALIGLVTDKRRLASLGSLGFILPIYAYFILHMSFLVGLGVLTALWTPFWGDLVRLGDIVYLPYVALVYPLSLMNLDIRVPLAGLFISLGLLVFILGVFAWFYARFKKKETADFWIYRFTRHPQYLGWILWSYGLMLRVALRHDTAFQQNNPGASLPWVISTLIIICVALSEEIKMRTEQGQEYEVYRKKAAFMLPIPKWLTRIISAPMRFFLHKMLISSRWDLIWVFFIYLLALMLISLPFVLLDFPPTGWTNWPFS